MNNTTKKALSSLLAMFETRQLTRIEIESTMKVYERGLARYTDEQIQGAIKRCFDEIKTRVVPSDIISRIDDGRPTANEAWAMLPQNEDESCFWTVETMNAWDLVRNIMDDKVAARMAFRDAYEREVKNSRENGQRVKWIFSQGRSLEMAKKALLDGINRGIISRDDALKREPLLFEKPKEEKQLTGEVEEFDLQHYIDKLCEEKGFKK